MEKTEREIAQKPFQELENEITKTKKRRKYTKNFEDETRKIVDQLHIIRERNPNLASLNKVDLPEKMRNNWYNELAYDEDVLDLDESNKEEIKAFEDKLYWKLREILDNCSKIVTNSIFEIEMFVKKYENEDYNKRSLVSKDESRDFEINLKIIKFKVNTRELIIFIMGMIISPILIFLLYFGLTTLPKLFGL